MVTYAQIVAATLVIAPVLTAIIITVLIVASNRRNNVFFLIIKTFNRTEVPILTKGRIKELREKGTLMSEAFIRKNGRWAGIGTFHQRFLMPFRKNKYLLLVEEWDVGRYRPMVRTEGYGVVKIYDLVKDAEGKAMFDLDGKPKYEERPQRTGLIEPMTNDDFDYIQHKLTEMDRRYAQEQKNTAAWKLIAGGFLVVVLTIGMVMSAYYNYNTATELKNGAVIQTQTIAETIYRLFSNETVREAARVVPPNQNIPAPPR